MALRIHVHAAVLLVYVWSEGLGRNTEAVMRVLPAMFVVCLLWTSTVVSHAGTIHVPADQPTIQSGIDAAVDGDTVLVAPGLYVERIWFMGKAITVKSSGGPAVTVIDGSGPGPSSVVTFAAGE